MNKSKAVSIVKFSIRGGKKWKQGGKKNHNSCTDFSQDWEDKEIKSDFKLCFSPQCAKTFCLCWSMQGKKGLEDAQLQKCSNTQICICKHLLGLNKSSACFLQLAGYQFIHTHWSLTIKHSLKDEQQ